jgi:hypothetical protein
METTKVNRLHSLDDFEYYEFKVVEIKDPTQI